MKYSGSCQCGKVSFDVDTTIDQVIACNCSRCRRLGSLLAAAKKENFTLKSGKDALSKYQFNKHVIHHLFCRVCGIKSFARGVGRDGGATVAVNTRCLDDVDIAGLNVVPYDGKHH